MEWTGRSFVIDERMGRRLMVGRREPFLGLNVSDPSVRDGLSTVRVPLRKVVQVRDAIHKQGIEIQNHGLVANALELLGM